MANQYKGEIKGSLGDKERTFRLTFESIVSIENRTGKSILDITNSFGNNNYSMRDVVIIMHEALKGAGDCIRRRQERWRIPFSTGGERATKYPIKEYLEIGLGVLKFSPKVFWDLSVTEFTSAVNGYKLSIGKNNSEPTQRKQMEELMRQFPD